MGADFDVSELNKLAVDIKNAGRDILPLARTVIQKSASDIKRDAQAFAPVDTGNLRSSIGHETQELTNSLTAEVGATAAYAAHVEFGTSRMAPRAFLGPALDRNGHAFVKAMEQLAQKVTER